MNVTKLLCLSPVELSELSDGMCMINITFIVHTVYFHAKFFV